MQAQITGGRIFYGRTVKVSDFEPKRAEVELNFGAPEGAVVDEALVDAISQRVVAKVHEMLGLAAPANTNGAARTTAVQTDKDRLAIEAGLPVGAKTEAKAGDPPATTTTRKPRKPPAVAEDPAAIGGDAAPKTNGASDPSDLGGDPAPKTTDAAEIGDDDLLTGSAPEISDEVLTTAITKKNAGVKNPVAIRQLIGRYTPQDGNAHQAREIEQGRRAAFIAELDTIKPLV